MDSSTADMAAICSGCTDLARRAEVPVYRGAVRPMVQNLVTAEYVHGPTGLDGADLPPPTISASPGHAMDRIVEIVSTSDEPVTLCTLGPLTNIGLYTELLQSRLEPDEDQNLDITRVIMRQTLRMRHMVEDFLNISRIDADRGLSMNFTRLENVAAIINDIVEIEGHGRDTHFFELSLPDPVPDLWADRAKLEEVFANLIGNAMKFSPRGGRIRVRGELHGPLLRFSISDEGIGMSKADQARLFRRFERVGTSGSSIPGTGLGLFICKHLIEAHGGTIWAESTEGEGSTFHFTVPLYDGQDQEAQDVGPRQN